MINTKLFKEKYGIHITTKMNGKMEGMQSLSTSSVNNPICIARAKDPTSICSKCYSNTMQGMYKDLYKCLANNTEVLTTTIIPINAWLKVNCLVFRLEAFGDIANVIQVINYFNFCKANPRVTFTLWTKNPHIIDTAIKQGNKLPGNLIIGISSPHMNIVSECKYDFVSFVFTVFDYKYATENSVKINCGNRKCLECLKCYTKHKGIIYINEILKSDASKYYKWLANQLKKSA